MNPASTNKPRVLYVDDDFHLRRAVGRVLARWFELVSVGTLDEAMEAVEASSFDGAIVDLEMPDTTGWETIERIRKVDERLARRAVVFTGATLTEQEREWAEARGYRVLAKNIRLEDLARAVLDRIAEVP